jgi:hypothetical protein
MKVEKPPFPKEAEPALEGYIVVSASSQARISGVIGDP